MKPLRNCVHWRQKKHSLKDKQIHQIIKLGIQLKLLEEKKDGALKIGKALRVSGDQGITKSFLKELRTCVLKKPANGFLFTEENPNNNTVDFTPTLAWWLGRSPNKGFPRHGVKKIESLLEDEGVLQINSSKMVVNNGPVSSDGQPHLGS